MQRGLVYYTLLLLQSRPLISLNVWAICIAGLNNNIGSAIWSFEFYGSDCGSASFLELKYILLRDIVFDLANVA